MRRSKRKSKINVLEATETRDIIFLGNREVEENRVHITKNAERNPQFSNKNIFRLYFPRRFRKPKVYRVLLHRDGSDHCVSLGENNLIDPLTNEEAENVVKRVMAIGLGKFQPISLKIALIIILLLLINIASILFLIFRSRIL